MSSYHDSFTYKGINSKDKDLIIAAFDSDNGFVDSFLSTDPIFSESWNGAKRFSYGAKYNSVASIKITLIKNDYSDFTLAETRDCLKWLTGSFDDNWLDLYIGEKIDYSYLGKITDVQQYKMDSRCIGLMITFTSVSPWAYSPIIKLDFNINNTKQAKAEDSDDYSKVTITDDGVLVLESSKQNNFYIDKNSTITEPVFSYLSNGIILLNPDGASNIVNNDSDDLNDYIYLDVIFKNNNSSNLTISNLTTGDNTTISNLKRNETVTIDNGQFILSDSPSRIFGNDFNFVWPKLAPGENEIKFLTDDGGKVSISYRYPIKAGDCILGTDEVN